jgi:hypothetical protein
VRVRRQIPVSLLRPKGAKRHFRALFVVVGALAVLSAGCGADSRGEHAQAEDSPPGGAASYEAHGTSPATVPAANRHKPRPWYRKGLRSVGFQSPTGNIRCALERGDGTQLLCKTMNNNEAVDVLRPDPNITATIPREPTLTYGRVWSSPRFYCWSETTGVTCRSLYSRHGFRINREGITEFIWKARVLTYSPGSGLAAPSTGLETFCDTHSCIDNFTNGTGYVVQCADGTWSHSGGRPGACSWHGGEADR